MWKTVLLAACAAAAAPALAAYRCVDDKGKSHFEDVPPAACGNVVIYEVSPSGAVLRRIEPTSTAPKVEKDKDAERRASEQKRRDAALIDSYNSEAEIDVARDRNLEIIRTRLEAAKVNFQHAEQRAVEVKRVAERNAALKPDLEKAEAERASQQATVARFQKDYDQTKAQFDADKQRWVELKGGQKGR